MWLVRVKRKRVFIQSFFAAVGRPYRTQTCKLVGYLATSAEEYSAPICVAPTMATPVVLTVQPNAPVSIAGTDQSVSVTDSTRSVTDTDEQLDVQSISPSAPVRAELDMSLAAAAAAAASTPRNSVNLSNTAHVSLGDLPREDISILEEGEIDDLAARKCHLLQSLGIYGIYLEDYLTLTLS